MKSLRDTLLEAFELNEKVYRLTGDYNTRTPLGGKILQLFKKKIEKMKSSSTVLTELNAEWKNFIQSNEVLELIESELLKVYKGQELEFINKISINGNEWKFMDNLNNTDDKCWVQIYGDFVLNIELFREVNINKMRKFKGTVNTPIYTTPYILKDLKDDNAVNYEIRDSFILTIENN